MRGKPRLAALALITCLPLAAHASTWRMDGIGDVDGSDPSPMLLPFNLTAQIDDAALAGGIYIQAECYGMECIHESGPASAVRFGGIAARLNPIIPDGWVYQRHVSIILFVTPDGVLDGELRISEDRTGNFDLNIGSNADGSWTGFYQRDDLPFWTLSAPRWAMVDPVGADPAGVPEPASGGLMGLGVGLALALGRTRLFSRSQAA